MDSLQTLLTAQEDESQLNARILTQAAALHATQSNTLEQKRLSKVTSKLSALRTKIRGLETRADSEVNRRRLQGEYEECERLELEKKDILQRMEGLDGPIGDEESKRERLIRLGIINPLENPDSIPDASIGTAEVDIFAEDVKVKEEVVQETVRTLFQGEFEGGYRDDAEDKYYNERIRHLSAPEIKGEAGAFNIPKSINKHLFAYQKTCLRWLYELHKQEVGGVLGDEMGLGKTVQMIAFLGALHFSDLLQGVVLVVCPATVLGMWTKEFHKWYPQFRVFVLHSSYLNGTGGSIESDSDSGSDGSEDESRTKRRKSGMEEYVQRAMKTSNILITTYSTILSYQKLLLPHSFGYCILDEGHKIRNPDAQISLACKQIKTFNRVILSGTPIQNNLLELWSLYDFVYPGRLGTLPVFKQEFSLPILVGGYANASNLQVKTAYKCACVLRDFIAPYLLRRMKIDVASDLPPKNEQVLFCKLTSVQKNKYVSYISSDDVMRIMSGSYHVLKGIDVLRKICNHPDLLDQTHAEYGLKDRSGKMLVVASLLEMWKEQGHRVLLFCQTRQMLDIIEKFVKNEAYKYLRMDGNTNIGARAALVDTYNNNEEYFVFLLTTKVGGLGINLTGANRVIIYDPDWNPSTDMQARERAWRLGQKKPVTIYRLMTSGSIEEKIYHRQIFKQFLTNKILKDPRQKRFFKSNDLHDLFSFEEGEDTETQSLFQESTVIPQVATVEDFKEQEGKKEDDDARILSALFESGVHSALEHDLIMNSSGVEERLVGVEVGRVAEEAVKALRRSRKAVMRTDAFKPTWTGKSGSNGAPLPLIKSEKQTSSILSNLRQKSGLAVLPENNKLEDICKFLKTEGGRVGSKRVVEVFGGKSKRDVQLLRVLLREVADFKDGGWLLKGEFR